MQAPSLFRDLVNLVSRKPVVVQSENATEPYWTVAQKKDKRVEMQAPSLFGDLVNRVSSEPVVVQSENATEPY